MQILCFGLSHHTAPVELREKFAFPDGELGAAALQLARFPGVSEAVIVSTCNRVELYVAVEEPVRGFAAVDEYIAHRSGSGGAGGPVGSGEGTLIRAGEDA